MDERSRDNVPAAFYANADEDIRATAWQVNCALVAAHTAGVPGVTLSDAGALERLVEYAHVARTQLAQQERLK